MLCLRSVLNALARLQPCAIGPAVGSANIRQYPQARSLRAFPCLHAIAADDIDHKQVVVLTMPMLSPTMTDGSLLHWLKDTGDQLEPYDLVFELETESLTENAYKVGDFAGKVGMQIECIEEAYLATQLVKSGSKPVPVGTPIALLCEDKEDIDKVAKHQLPEDLNEYSQDKQHSYSFATWQSYLKERSEPTGSCM